MEYEETKPERMRYEQWILLNEGHHNNIKPFPKDAAKAQPGYSEGFTPYEDDVSTLWLKSFIISTPADIVRLAY